MFCRQSKVHETISSHYSNVALRIHDRIGHIDIAFFGRLLFFTDCRQFILYLPQNRHHRIRCFGHDFLSIDQTMKAHKEQKGNYTNINPGSSR